MFGKETTKTSPLLPLINCLAKTYVERIQVKKKPVAKYSITAKLLAKLRVNCLNGCPIGWLPTYSPMG